MSGDRKSVDSLEEELACEDAVIAAGERCRLRRQETKDDKTRKVEEDKLHQSKEAMFQAGDSSRARRRMRQT